MSKNPTPKLPSVVVKIDGGTVSGKVGPVHPGKPVTVITPGGKTIIPANRIDRVIIKK